MNVGTYTAKFVRSDGQTITFDRDHKMLVNIDPLSELDIDISTSQGFQQVGVTVENRAVSGVSRELSGIILGKANDNKNKLISVFSTFAEGKLYFNEKYYCDCVVSKTPAIDVKDRNAEFSVVLFCASPYWFGATSIMAKIGGYTKAFEFPVCYDEHIFGKKSGDSFANVTNSGNVDTAFTATFSADLENSGVANYGLINVYTMETLQINDTLYAGEMTTVYWDGTALKVEKTVDGEVTDIFSLLDESSTLFWLEPGENVLKVYADNGLLPTATVEYEDAYTGVYDGM